MNRFKEFMGPVIHVIKKEFIEMRRTRLIAILIVAPILQAIVFGYVATTDITNVPTLICDEDGSAMSRSLTGKFLNSEYFSITAVVRDPGVDTARARRKQGKSLHKDTG